MQLVETHYIRKNHKFYKECERLCKLSKLIYNEANYIVRQEFITNHKYTDNFTLQKQLQRKSPNYTALPAKVSQQTLKNLHINWRSFFKSIKEWKKNPEKFLGMPGLPNYKKIYSEVIYDAQAISKKKLKKNIVVLSQTIIELLFQHKGKRIKQARIIPENKGLFKIEIVYKCNRKDKKLNKENYIGIDLGLNNLCAIVGNTITPKLINGKIPKSYNQYYNKKKAKLQENLPKKQYTSNRIQKLTNKRNRKIEDYMHRVSRHIINLCLTNNVGTIVIGYNDNWKQEINMNRRNNQAFVNIPFYKLFKMLEYKADLVGIALEKQEESYTSKCSFMDNEELCHHSKYLGKRVKRGLFRSSTNGLISADINGAANILRKRNSQFNINSNEGIQAVSVQPMRINPHKRVL